MRFHKRLCMTLLFLIASLLLTNCASYEKQVSLTYDPTFLFAGGGGEVDVAEPVIEARLEKLPGGKVVLGAVQDSITQIVTTDNISEWVKDALVQELYHAGYKVNKIASRRPKAQKTVLLRLVSLSGNQYPDGLMVGTYTQIGIRAEVWQRGGLVKTITATASAQERGVNRSGGPVSKSLRETLQSALEQLVPGIIDSLEANIALGQSQ